VNNTIPIPHGGEAVCTRRDCGEIIEIPNTGSTLEGEENYRSLRAHDCSIPVIREWRRKRKDAGEPWGYRDFWTVNKYCDYCCGSGLKSIPTVTPGWIAYAQCPECNGTGDLKR
jgi:hypothetical protein